MTFAAKVLASVRTDLGAPIHSDLRVARCGRCPKDRPR